MKIYLAFLFIVTVVVGSFAQQRAQNVDLSNYGVKIQPDKRVIAVLATLDAARTKNAAGEDVPSLDVELSPQGREFRDLLRSDLINMPADLRQRISNFVNAYKRRPANKGKSDSDLIAPFITMAYSLTPAPSLEDPVVTVDLPGSLLDVLDFAPLVRETFRRTTLTTNMDDYVKRYTESTEGQFKNSARDMVLEILDFLNTRPQTQYSERIQVQTSKSNSKKGTIKKTELVTRERRFYIVPELLAPVGTLSFINIKDEYNVVLPPNRDLSFSDIRRSFLQFVIDPIVLAQSREIETIKPNVKKLIDDRRKENPNQSPDIYLTVSRSLVAAIDAKQVEDLRIKIATAQARQRIDQMKTTAEKEAVSAELARFTAAAADESILRMSEDYDRGAILVFYFAEQLKGIEDAGFDINASIREMILSFVPEKEEGRYAKYSAERERAIAERKRTQSEPAGGSVVENPVTAKLIEIQKVIDAKQYEKARTELSKLLDSNPSEPRIYYNLGFIASLEAENISDEDGLKSKLFESKVAYENVIRTAQALRAENKPVDMALLSRSYVALAKIYEFYGDETYAIQIYDAAINIGPVTNGAHAAAIAGKQKLVQNQPK